MSLLDEGFKAGSYGSTFGANYSSKLKKLVMRTNISMSRNNARKDFDEKNLSCKLTPRCKTLNLIP